MPTTRNISRLCALALGTSLLALGACSEAEENAANQVLAQAADSTQPSTSDSAAPAPAAGGEASATAEPGAGAKDPAAVLQASSLGADVEAPEPSGSADVAALMEETELPDIVIGDPDAPVTIVEYSSMTCPHCAAFHTESYPAIKSEFIDTGVAKLIVREFPFDPRSLAAFTLARCMPDDERRTAMIDVLFKQQNQWARSENASTELLRVARMSGMSEDEFRACLTNEELQNQIMDVQARGQEEFGVTATPTFFVNGDKYSGTLSAEQMGAVIRQKFGS